MNRLIIILLVLALISMADCRTPVVGENVTVNLGSAYFTGVVTNVTEGYVSLNNSEYHSGGKFRWMHDVCIGWGQIMILSWD